MLDNRLDAGFEMRWYVEIRLYRNGNNRLLLKVLEKHKMSIFH